MLKSKRKPILQPPQAEKEYNVIVLSEQCDGCELCVEFCPRDVLKINLDSFNSRMLHYASVTHLDECTGCQQCERLCPSVSIFVLEKELT